MLLEIVRGNSGKTLDGTIIRCYFLGMTAQERLIASLEERQRTLGESDGRFAARLGMSRQMWGVLKAGGSNLSIPIVQGILAAFPEFGPLATALLFLPSDAKKPSLNDGEMATEPAAV